MGSVEVRPPSTLYAPEFADLLDPQSFYCILIIISFIHQWVIHEGWCNDKIIWICQMISFCSWNWSGTTLELQWPLYTFLLFNVQMSPWARNRPIEELNTTPCDISIKAHIWTTKHEKTIRETIGGANIYSIHSTGPRQFQKERCGNHRVQADSSCAAYVGFHIMLGFCDWNLWLESPWLNSLKQTQSCSSNTCTGTNTLCTRTQNVVHIHKIIYTHTQGQTESILIF